MYTDNSNHGQSGMFSKYTLADKEFMKKQKDAQDNLLYMIKQT